jgi:penicillin-binding protein 2
VSKWVKVIGGVLLGLMMGSGVELVAITSSSTVKHHSSGTAHASVAKTRVTAKKTSRAKKSAKKVTVTATSSRRRGARTKLAVRRTRHYESDTWRCD